MPPFDVSLAQIQARGYSRESFAAAVEKYRADRVTHSATIGQPAPVPEIPGIEQCVVRIPPDADNDERFVSDYRIIDDLPPHPAPPTLDEKKAAHVQATHKLAQAAFEANIPPLRRRYWGNLYMVAQAVEADKREDGTKLFVTQHEERLAKERDINTHLGKLESQIHDLTDETVDAWKPEAFPS
jgi:hypothetical protein